MPFNDSLPPYDHPHPLLRDASSGRATPFPSTMNNNGGSPHSDADSGFGDDSDCTRPINWGSVLSLSSQSALDPLGVGTDLFATTGVVSASSGSPVLTPITPTMISSSSASVMADLPPTDIDNATSTSSAHLKVLTSNSSRSNSVGSSVGSSVGGSNKDQVQSDSEGDSGISMMDEDEDEGANSTTQLLSIGSSSSSSSILCGNLRTTTSTSTSSSSISSMSHSEMLPSWLDMESELLPSLLPSWKLTPLSADDILKSVPHQQQARIVHEAEMETGFTHIMVGS